MNAPFPGGVKWSQVTPAPTPPAQTDYVLGLQNGNLDVLFSFAQLQNLIGGGMPTRPVVTPSAQSSLVVKSAPGNVYSAYAINLSYVDGFLLLLDEAALGADGPVTPIAAVPLPSGATSELGIGAPIIFTSGIVAVLSSGPDPFHQVTNGGLTGFISCQAQ